MLSWSPSPSSLELVYSLGTLNLAHAVASGSLCTVSTLFRSVCSVRAGLWECMGSESLRGRGVYICELDSLARHHSVFYSTVSRRGLVCQASQRTVSDVRVRFELYHLAHGLFPGRQLSAPPPEAPALPTDVHAVDAVPLAFPLARDGVVSEAPVRGNRRE